MCIDEMTNKLINTMKSILFINTYYQLLPYRARWMMQVKKMMLFYNIYLESSSIESSKNWISLGFILRESRRFYIDHVTTINISKQELSLQTSMQEACQNFAA